ncbi:chalcone isomerase family protein [Dickeya parazeae]|nr:hypothetical protein [Dickeya parazeae]
MTKQHVPLLAWLVAALYLTSAQAADWTHWRNVGDATLRFGPFSVYRSQLRTPDGRYSGLQQDQALIITYQRHIDSETLVDATREQWQALGILDREPQSEAWLHMLAQLWPSVDDGSQLAFVTSNRQGQFWYRPSSSQGQFMPLGPVQSAAFSACFLSIWLSPQTHYPELRQQLLGGER